MSEKSDQAEIRRRYPDQRAREAADEAIDQLPEETPLVKVCGVWNDTYYKHARTKP